MVQYLNVVVLVLPQYGVWIHFFLFGSSSHNIDGFNDPNDADVLLEFRTMISLNNFIKSFFINCSSNINEKVCVTQCIKERKKQQF